MDKPIVHRNQQQQHVLKCPRCDSSNTKFCYYNNYSLSQPRHFCKACKRYWTRGGILRNVPVGGGCRKNKRVKKPPTTTAAAAAATAVAPVVHYPNPDSNPNLDHNPSANNRSHPPNSLFHGSVPQNPNYIKFDSRVYDLLPPQMNPLGLGFSSAISPIQTNHNKIVSSSPAAPPMGSLLAATLDRQERFAPYEYGCGLMDWAHGFRVDSDRIKPVEPSDLSSMLWNTADDGGGGWLEPTNNIGTSVHSLI